MVHDVSVCSLRRNLHAFRRVSVRLSTGLTYTSFQSRIVESINMYTSSQTLFTFYGVYNFRIDQTPPLLSFLKFIHASVPINTAEHHPPSFSLIPVSRRRMYSVQRSTTCTRQVQQYIDLDVYIVLNLKYSVTNLEVLHP